MDNFKEILKEIMKEEIATYREWKQTQGYDYCYDEAYTLFDNLKRGQAMDIMEELVKE